MYDKVSCIYMARDFLPGRSAKNSMEITKAIKCKNCGGAMYSDQKTASYLCPFCASKTPWDEGNYYRTLPIHFRHKPVVSVDGYLKLGHVEIPQSVWSGELLNEQRLRLRGVDDLLAEVDQTTYAAFANIYLVTLPCPNCGAEIQGESTQSIFTCGYCGNKLGSEEALRPGAYRKELIMGVGAQNLADQGLPFQVGLEQARRSITDLVRAYPDDFAGQDMERRIKEDLTAVYIPYDLSDLSIKARVETEKGSFKLYQEIIDWARPQTPLYDGHLLDRLDPWDFGDIGNFDPAFLEGNVRIASIMNELLEDSSIMERIILRRLPDEVRSSFGVKKAKIVQWSADLRRHKYAYMMLPVYYLDKRPADDEHALQVRIAVNGQTGKVAALFLKGDEIEYYRTLEPSQDKAFSAESTVRTGLVPVRYVKAPFLHKILPFEKALE